MPSAMLNIIGLAHQFPIAAIGLVPALGRLGYLPLSHALCPVVVDSKAPLVIEDGASDPRFREHPAVVDLGIKAYLGVPLLRRGQCVAVLCVLGPWPRRWPERHCEQLSALAVTASGSV